MSEDKKIGQEERFDELFRQSLGTMKVEPPARTWDRMSRKMLLKELAQFNFSNLPGYTWVIAAAVAVVIGVGVWWLTDVEESSQSAVVETQSAVVEDQSAVGSRQSEVLEDQTAVSSSQSAGVEDQSAVGSSQSAVGSSQLAVPSRQPAVVEEQPKVVGPEAVMVESRVVTTGQRAPEPVPGTVSYTVSEIRVMTLLEAESSGMATELILPEMARVVNPVPVMKSLAAENVPAGKSIQQSLQIGLNITPEMVFYRNTSDYFKYDYTLDAGVRYNFGKLYIGSGVGISWSTDVGNYAISANKNDSVGYYYSVVSFEEDPQNPGEMEYTTTMKTVYDTNQYVYDYSTKNSYTYLEIPLVIGFWAVDKPLWSLGVDAGGFWSYMLNSDEPPPVFYIPEGRVTDVENQTPERRKSSFGLSASLSFDYRFSRQFSLLISPTFKYHLNSIEENEIPGATQPWSIGLRAGIWYSIGLKK